MSPLPASDDTCTAPQRVVMLAHSHLLGGIERHVVALARTLTDAGHAVAYAGPLDGWLGEQMQTAAYACEHVAMRGMYDPLSVWRIGQLIRRFGASVLHGHAQRGGRYADWASRCFGVPAVVTGHSTNAFGWFKPHMRVLAVSGAVREAAVAAGLPAARVSVVYSGVPDSGPPQPPPLERPLKLGLIGRLEAVKGLDIALRALALLKAAAPNQPLPCRLDVIGPDDTAWAQEMRGLTEQLGLRLGDEVRFLGASDQVPQLLAGLDAVLAPSRREALPLALMEAAAAGRAVLATRVGGVPEIVQHGHTGWLTPTEQPQALAEALTQVVQQPGLLQAWGAAARQRYLAHFTLPAMREQVVAQYRLARAEAGLPPSVEPAPYDTQR